MHHWILNIAKHSYFRARRIWGALAWSATQQEGRTRTSTRHERTSETDLAIPITHIHQLTNTTWEKDHSAFLASHISDRIYVNAHTSSYYLPHTYLRSKVSHVFSMICKTGRYPTAFRHVFDLLICESYALFFVGF